MRSFSVIHVRRRGGVRWYEQSASGHLSHQHKCAHHLRVSKISARGSSFDDIATKTSSEIAPISACDREGDAVAAAAAYAVQWARQSASGDGAGRAQPACRRSVALHRVGCGEGTERPLESVLLFQRRVVCGEDLRRELAPVGAFARKRLTPKVAERLLGERLDRLCVALVALKVIGAVRDDLRPVARRLLAQLLVLLELDVEQRLLVVVKFLLSERRENVGHRVEKGLDPLVEVRGVVVGRLDDEAQPDDAHVDAHGAPDDVAQLLHRAQLLLRRLVHNLRDELDDD
eukprot:6175811-Pleurochrysis_carterae.AAC.5